MHFVRIGDYRINLDKVLYIETTNNGLYIFMGAVNQHGEEIASIVLYGKEAATFLAYVDKWHITLLGYCRIEGLPDEAQSDSD